MGKILDLVAHKEVEVNILDYFTTYEDIAVKSLQSEYDRRMQAFDKHIEDIEDTEKSVIIENINLALEYFDQSVQEQGREHIKRVNETSIPIAVDGLLERSIFGRKLLKDQLEKLNGK
jgi:hypothetical protein